MSLERIISQFGNPALIAGLLLESETVLVLAAFMAHRGYLSLRLVILIGFVTTFASDQFFFWLGHTRGINSLKRSRHGNQMWKRQGRCWDVIRPCYLLDSNSCMVCERFDFILPDRTHKTAIMDGMLIVESEA